MPPQQRRIHPKIRKRAKELRQPLTPAENRLWNSLRNRQLGGYKFRRQHPIGYYIIDFYCDETRLLIEIDGDTHGQQIEYDQERTAWLESQGYHLIRFTNQQVLTELPQVLEAIIQAYQYTQKRKPQS